jgi:hypothetical protein
LNAASVTCSAVKKVALQNLVWSFLPWSGYSVHDLAERHVYHIACILLTSARQGQFSLQLYASSLSFAGGGALFVATTALESRPAISFALLYVL